MKIAQIEDGHTIWFAEHKALENALSMLGWKIAPYGFGVYRVSEPDNCGEPPDPYIELCEELYEEFGVEVDEDDRISVTFEYREDLQGDWTLTYR